MEDAVCPTCLSHGRSLYPLQHVALAYSTLLAGLQPNEQTEQSIAFGMICWECHSFLKKTLRFQTQVLHAGMLLQSYSETVRDVSYSMLGSVSKVGVDVELTHEETSAWDAALSESCQEEVKTESEPSSATNEAANEEKPKRKRKQVKKRESREEKITVVTMSSHDLERYRLEDRQSSGYAEAPFKCESCIRGFLFADMLARHDAAKHNPEAPYKCDVCRTSLATAELLARHHEKHLSLYRCAACGYSARALSEVERHRAAAHEPQQSFACDQCDSAFPTKRKLRYHKESAHKEAVKCEVCGKVMINRYSIKHHMLTHTGMPTFECSLCHKVYRGEAGLYSHMRHFHSREPAETYCVQCDIHFKNKTLYRSHLKRSERHATADELKFACEKCPKRFISEASLRKHHRYYHLDYVCQICHKRLKNWFSLDNHIKYVHEGREMPRKHMCETCGKGFKTKTMLSNHQTTHTGARPHACELCGAAFSVKASLRTHKRHVHLKTAKAAPPVYQYGP